LTPGVAGLKKETKQNGRPGDAEGCGEDSHGLRIRRILEGVSEKVDTIQVCIIYCYDNIA
jgi:hypothetical protein